MSIQSNINQVLSMAGALGALKGKFDKQAAAKAKKAEAAAAGTKPKKTEVAETTATTSLTTAQEGKRKTRRNFLDYIKDEPTSLGANVGQLDKKLQREIARNYSSSERRRIMDRKDAEREQK